jgi:hypothetical protein
MKNLHKLQFGTWIINFGKLFKKLWNFEEAAVYAHSFVEKTGLKGLKTASTISPNFLNFHFFLKTMLPT